MCAKLCCTDDANSQQHVLFCQFNVLPHLQTAPDLLLCFFFKIYKLHLFHLLHEQRSPSIIDWTKSKQRKMYLGSGQLLNLRAPEMSFHFVLSHSKKNKCFLFYLAFSTISFGIYLACQSCINLWSFVLGSVCRVNLYTWNWCLLLNAPKSQMSNQ